MKKVNRSSKNGMRSEYDFATMQGGVRGKYSKRFRAGTNLVLLDSDVAEAFPSEKAVNQALRTVMTAAKFVPRKRRRPPNNALQPPPGRRVRARGKARAGRRG